MKHESNSFIVSFSPDMVSETREFCVLLRKTRRHCHVQEDLKVAWQPRKRAEKLRCGHLLTCHVSCHHAEGGGSFCTTGTTEVINPLYLKVAAGCFRCVNILNLLHHILHAIKFGFFPQYYLTGVRCVNRFQCVVTSIPSGRSQVVVVSNYSV